jgi:hypothetical protein
MLLLTIRVRPTRLDDRGAAIVKAGIVGAEVQFESVSPAEVREASNGVTAQRAFSRLRRPQQPLSSGIDTDSVRCGGDNKYKPEESIED